MKICASRCCAQLMKKMLGLIELDLEEVTETWLRVPTRCDAQQETFPSTACEPGARSASRACDSRLAVVERILPTAMAAHERRPYHAQDQEYHLLSKVQVPMVVSTRPATHHDDRRRRRLTGLTSS
jgi:hypothetical protein